ncbi:MAG: recombinase family protein [Lachnospiraceae bacterium]|nr:recombinase family protein [Lachnospiraceae bacterium]
MERLRAVAVCRCSTEEESQKDALIQQEKEARACIAEMGWLLVDTYVEAKSGTTVKGRKEYNRLFEDLDKDKFDIIVIKSQDRLMRNTKDWYIFLDKMQKNKKQLYMYLERKFYTPDDALITGIKAILAEEYSRDLSKKINNAHKNRQADGNHFVITNATYGYKKNEDKQIVIDETDVLLIKLIFELAAEGHGTYVISRILYQKGYRNRQGNMINTATIRRIIKNPMYVGDIIQNKKHFDFESKQVYNNPESDWIVHRNAVPAIISRELFAQANASLIKRAGSHVLDESVQDSSVNKKAFLSSKVWCGLCEQPYYRCTRKNTKGKMIAEWKCLSYVQHGRTMEYRKRKKERDIPQIKGEGCDNVHINEDKMYNALKELCQGYNDSFSKEDLIETTLNILKRVINTNETGSKRNELLESIKKYETQKEILLDKLLEGVISDSDYKRKAANIQECIDNAQKDMMLLKDAMDLVSNTKVRLDGIKKSLDESIVDKAKVEDISEYIKKIEVFPDDIKIFFDYTKLVNLKESELYKVADAEEFVRIIPINDVCTGNGKAIEAEKKEIISMMKSNPKITAKVIAQAKQCALSRINRRIAELKKEGKIQYSTPNGKGHWIVKDI